MNRKTNTSLFKWHKLRMNLGDLMVKIFQRLNIKSSIIYLRGFMFLPCILQSKGRVSIMWLYIHYTTKYRWFQEFNTQTVIIQSFYNVQRKKEYGPTKFIRKIYHYVEKCEGQPFLTRNFYISIDIFLVTNCSWPHQTWPSSSWNPHPTRRHYRTFYGVTPIFLPTWSMMI